MKDFNARWVAYQVLNHLEKRQGNSTTLLQEALLSVVDSKDRHFITDLVLGTIRWRARLLFLLSEFSRRRLHQIDREVVLILQLGAYQLLYTNVAPHAAIYETVKLCKIARLTSAASFVNGILRGIQGRLTSLPEPKVNVLATRFSHPEWLVERWAKRSGEEATIAMMQRNNQPAAVYLHVNPLLADVDTVIKRLASEGVIAESTTYGDTVLRVVEGAAQNTKSFLDGEFYIQDSAIQLLGDFIDPAQGETILEIAAAPGGKTFQLACRMMNRGKIIAVDSSVRRMKAWQKNIERLKITCAEPVVAEAQHLQFLGKFDKVIVDAPCSSLGVIGRHPEIRWWRQEADLAGFMSLQLQILDACAKYVRSQGGLIYTVCSFEPEETEYVRDAFLSAQPSFSKQLEMTLLPHRDHTDGFYALKMKNSPQRHGER
jgi:16S rRNA (cytosine967-C5)-methyltransferase